MGNGTVYDTVENDVLSGCDKMRILKGGADENWYIYAGNNAKIAFALTNVTDLDSANPYNCPIYCAHLPEYNGVLISQYTATSKGVSARSNMAQIFLISPEYAGMTVDDFRAYLSANPLTVYYRSTAYTPDKDLRVCKVVRRYAKITITGSETITNAQTSGLYNDDNSNRYRAQIFLPNGIKIKAQSVSDVKSNVVCNVYDTASGADTWYQRDGISDAGTSAANRVYIYDSACADEGADAYKAKFKALYEAGTPVVFFAELATPETYMTDPLVLRKPTGMEEVTVTGSAETAVTYPCDTKSYIDRKFDALAAALLS